MTNIIPMTMMALRLTLMMSMTEETAKKWDQYNPNENHVNDDMDDQKVGTI